MSHTPKYDTLCASSREELEENYRKLVNLIPAWRRSELDAECKFAANAELLLRNLEFSQHWDDVADHHQISSWADYIDPAK